MNRPTAAITATARPNRTNGQIGVRSIGLSFQNPSRECRPKLRGIRSPFVKSRLAGRRIAHQCRCQRHCRDPTSPSIGHQQVRRPRAWRSSRKDRAIVEQIGLGFGTALASWLGIWRTNRSCTASKLSLPIVLSKFLDGHAAERDHLASR